MKIFVVGGMINYACFLKDASLVDKIEEADVVLFTGGEDVTPSFYGSKKISKTYCNPKRDAAEKAVFDMVKPNQICLGICRGSQFLCVMNGGKLVQHVTGHTIGYTHGITNGSVAYEITSTHHQMQYPYNLKDTDYEILFRADGNRSQCYEGYDIDYEPICSFGEPEIVLYHVEGKPKCLAVQGHPEMIPNSPVAEMISNLVKKLVDESR